MPYSTKIIYTLAQLARKVGYKFHEERDARVVAMQQDIARRGGSLEFSIDQHPDGTWTAESTNIDGIITGGDNLREVNEMVKDAIFTYYEIPPHLVNDALIRGENEPVTVRRRIYA